MAEITRKSVLLECLSIMREEQRICSKGYNCLEPAKGMEEAWEQGRRKITILQEIIQALDSEPVLRAMAGWQKEIMEKGTPGEINSEFRIQNSELSAAAEGEPSTTAGMKAAIAINELTKEDKGYATKLLKNIATEIIRSYNMDTEDGTMELR